MDKKYREKSNQIFDSLDVYERKIQDFKSFYLTDQGFIERLGDKNEVAKHISNQLRYLKDYDYKVLRQLIEDFRHSHIIFKLHHKRLQKLEYRQMATFRKLEKEFHKVFNSELRQLIKIYEA